MSTFMLVHGAGHSLSPFLSKPEELAGHLDTLART